MDYISLEKLNELTIKQASLTSNLAALNSEKEKTQKRNAELKAQILAKEPGLQKKIEKIEKHPNTAYSKYDQLHNGYDEFGDICREFTSTLERGYSSLPAEIVKLAKKISDLDQEITCIKSRLTRHFQIRDNLPIQFHEALEKVRGSILAYFTSQRDANIAKAKENMRHPLDAVIRTPERDWYGEHRHTLYKAWIKVVGKDDYIIRNDEEWIAEFKKHNIQANGYCMDTEENLKKHSKVMVDDCLRVISQENSRDLQKETDVYFEEVKCRFIDEIARYCSDILSVEVANLGMDGSINGIINASNGKFSIKTIGAGGYNIRCYHYRVIIRKVA